MDYFKGLTHTDPIEQGFFVLVHLPYLQPFLDVNKRVSRLATNIPLIRQNLCPLSFVEVPRQEYTEGLLAVYELNQIELARDTFAWAYRRSCERYAAVRQVIGEPDLFRLRYRPQLKQLVNEIVVGAMDKTTAITYIRTNAAAVPPNDRVRFIEVVETELLSLHEGNFARYRVRLSQFEAWQANWH